MAYEQTPGMTGNISTGGEYDNLGGSRASFNPIEDVAGTTTGGYAQKPGMTGNISAGGEYDNLDSTTSLLYPNMAANDAAEAALSAAAAAASATASAGSATSASTSATSAASSASSAATSATNAASSAASAASSATSAGTSATNASASATAASTSATNAANSASAASTSAGSASTSATNAADSATTASTAATTATTQAGIATTQATNAANSASAASTSATNAASSASAASTSASSASTSATNAASSASAASTSATNSSNSAAASATSATASAASATSASTSATNAATSATSAASSATAAEAAYDSFDDRYLGAKTSDPTTDNDGNALITGALYFNSTTSIMRVYSGVSWVNTPGIATGGLTGQVLAKLSNTNYDTQWVSLTGGLIYGGSWNASTNTPTLTSSVGTTGTYYVVSVSGGTNLNGITDWVIGDWAIFNGSEWQKIDQTNLVTSVAGRTGNVTLSNTDISGLGTAAVQNTTYFATAAQGTLADNAISSITSTDGSVVINPTGTVRDLSVGTALNTATLISQVRNETGATLTKGTVVYISGAAGNKALVSKALATGDSTSAQTYGVIQADINNNQNGYVVVIGTVSGINTSAYADGTQLYLSGVTAGTYTSTKPYAPIHLVYVGIVTYSHATQGAIQIRIQNGYELDELHNVSAQSPTNGQTIVYNSATSLWEATTLDSLPSQATHSGQFLTTNGTSASWATVDALPSQTGNAGEYLTTDGTNASWSNTLTATTVTASNGIFLNSQTVSASMTIPTGQSGMSSGPVSIASGQTVTISSGSRWVIV